MDIENPASLAPYLRAKGLLDLDESLRSEVLTGGVSNKTVLVRREPRTSWVLKQALGRLRTSAEWFADPRRITREALGMRELSRLLPSRVVPGLVFEDPEENLLAMTAVPQPHDNFKSLLLGGRIETTLIEQFGLLLACLHRESYARREELASIFADRSFFESLRVEPYYSYSATRSPAASAFLLELIGQTRRHTLALVHGDFSPKNILVHQGRLVLLDHEVIHWGDPAFDVGFALTHLLSKAHHLSQHRLAMVAAANHWVATYLDALGHPPWRKAMEPRAVRQTLACLLARVIGRSPLEYLTAEERERQRRICERLMASPPVELPALIERFAGALEAA